MLKFVKSICFLFLVSICIDTNALTLDEALVSAYKVNPELNAQRENLKASDEQIMQALSRWLPSAALRSSKQYTDNKKIAQAVDPSTGIPLGKVSNRTSDGVGHSLTISQNLFRSGADIASMQAARYAVENARANLNRAEQEVFLKVVGAYMSTIQASEAHTIAMTNEKDSGRILKSVQHRFKVGDVSKTEVELAKAALSSARSQTIGTQANYEVYKANLGALIGTSPSNLIIPKDDIMLPQSLNDTVNMSLLKNPSMVATKNLTEAEKKKIDIQRGDVLPSVDLSHTINDNTQFGYSSSTGLRNHTTVVQLNVPILAVGQWSQLREQKRKAASAQSTLASVTDSVKASALQAWVSLKAQKESLKALEDEYKARSAAYKGAQALEKAGQVSTIDLIDYKNQYFNSYAQYIKARSDYYTALYTLKSMVGECTAQGLGLKVPYYDPLKNYNSIKWQLIGAF